MRKLLLALFLALPLCAWATELTQEVAPKTPLTKRVMLVMDCSGSMVTSDNVVAKALEQLSQMLNQPVDDMEIAVICFNDSTTRWAGVPEDGLKANWARLPSVTATKDAFDFVAQSYVSGSATYFVQALQKAIAEPVADMTIVIITDGLNTHETEDEIVKQVRLAQTARAKANLGAAPIWAIDADAEADKWLKELAEAYGGGYWVCE